MGWPALPWGRASWPFSQARSLHSAQPAATPAWGPADLAPTRARHSPGGEALSSGVGPSTKGAAEDLGQGLVQSWPAGPSSREKTPASQGPVLTQLFTCCVMLRTHTLSVLIACGFLWLLPLLWESHRSWQGHAPSELTELHLQILLGTQAWLSSGAGSAVAPG